MGIMCEYYLIFKKLKVQNGQDHSGAGMFKTSETSKNSFPLTNIVH